MERRVHVGAERTIDAPPDRVMAILSDYREGRPRLLPPNFLDYQVESGGQGSGTVVTYRLQAGRRERGYRMEVEQMGSDELVERDSTSSFVTRWTVRPAGTSGSMVTVSTDWKGTGGVRGFFERTFAPMGLRRIYREMLDRLAAEARTTSPSTGSAAG